MRTPADFGLDHFTLPAVLDHQAAAYPDQVVLRVAGEAVTFEQLRAATLRAAKVLRDNGVGRGDGVALFGATSLPWIYFWLACSRIGAVAAAVNAANRGSFLAHALRLAEAKVVIADGRLVERVDEVAGDLPLLETILVHEDGSGVSPVSGLRLVSVSGALSAAQPQLVDAAATAWNEVGTLFFTSGTTGPSKAVATTWHYLMKSASICADAWEFGEGETIWTAMPLFHLSAVATVLSPILVGGRFEVATSFSPKAAWDSMREVGAIGFVGVGAMVSMLWNIPPSEADRQLGLRFISAAPISASMYRAIEERYGCKVVTMYGLTEAFPIAAKKVRDEGVPGTSGTATDHFELTLLDSDDEPVPTGAVGEICVRPRFAHVMSEGYARAPEATLERMSNLWFHTGDLGTLDAGGNLTFVDRAKDSMRRRGENVSSFELEQIVMTHPAVLEAAAIGVPSELGEDDILVAVTLEPGAEFGYESFLDYCNARMPHYYMPRYVEIMDELPKNAVGRIRKDVLRERSVGPKTWDREQAGYIVQR